MSLAFAKMMATPAGRLVRIVAGLALIALGLFVIGGAVGIVVAVVGLWPILAGIFNVCVIAPIIRAPFSGRAASSS